MTNDYLTRQYMARLQFRGARGETAQFHCYQELVPCIDTLTVVTERAWGDTLLTSAIESPTDRVTDRSPDELNRTILTSSLTYPRRRLMVLERFTVRELHGAFTSNEEWWEYAAFTPTDWARVAIGFPAGRTPTRVHVAADSSTAAPFVSRPGTNEIILSIKAPKLGSVYRIEWTW